MLAVGSQEYRDNWDAIFAKKEPAAEQPSPGSCDPLNFYDPVQGPPETYEEFARVKPPTKYETEMAMRGQRLAEMWVACGLNGDPIDFDADDCIDVATELLRLKGLLGDL